MKVMMEIWPLLGDSLYAKLMALSVVHFVAKSLNMFSAAMGVSEGKSIGHWFGPNTVAQVLR